MAKKERTYTDYEMSLIAAWVTGFGFIKTSCGGEQRQLKPVGELMSGQN